MRSRVALVLLAVGLVAFGMPSCKASPDRETLAQFSTIDALIAGVYDSVTTVGELKHYGDFGIGTFTALDGEMIELDGKFYQIKSDGIAYPAADSAGSPFAAITYFDADRAQDLPAGLDYASLQTYLDGLLPTQNIFYAIKITGTFSYVKTRSVPAQAKPYPPLTEATAKQSVFEFNNVEGTIVGFRCPPYVNGVNVPGYHLHFLTEDKKAGGHVLELKTAGARALIDDTSKFRMLLPGPGSDFYKLNLATDSSGDLDKAEK